MTNKFENFITLLQYFVFKVNFGEKINIIKNYYKMHTKINKSVNQDIKTSVKKD